jgi:hypothetical protein
VEELTMLTTEKMGNLVLAEEPDRSILARIDALLEAEQRGPALVVIGGEQVALPEIAQRLLHQLVHALAEDQPVGVVSLPRELSVHHAADLLDIQVEAMVGLLDAGEIPSLQRGLQRRIPLAALLDFRERRNAERRQGLRELTQLSQSMGLYEIDRDDD